MKQLLARLALFTVACSLLAACNTMQGFGKDVKKVGDKIEDAAKK